MIDFSDVEALNLPKGPSNEELLQDAKTLGEEFQVLRSGELASETYLLFRGIREPNRSFHLTGIGSEGLHYMGEILLEVAAALDVIENGSIRDRGDFWIKHSTVDHLEPH